MEEKHEVEVTMKQSNPDKLNIFVHRASDCLTDHESHGDGLICFSLLNGLAKRGHHIYAYTNNASIRSSHPNLKLKTARHRVPANSLASWEHAWRADRWLKQLTQREKIDLVWRMHPYGTGCPTVPNTQGRPLIIGPMFYDWPVNPALPVTHGRPRLGIGIQPLLMPAANQGWDNALRRSALLICATEPHSAFMRQRIPGANVLTLPVIVEPLKGASLDTEGRARSSEPDLLFVANLYPHKHPEIFCETIKMLREQGLSVTGTLLGDGPLRIPLQEWCQANGLRDALCFAGKVSNEEVYERMRKADALLSISCGEPYGRSIVEAMSVGTPVICHRSGGPADYIESGLNGLLTDDLTPTAYAQAVEKLMAPSVWAKLSSRAYADAKQWTSDVVLAHLEHELVRLVRTTWAR